MKMMIKLSPKIKLILLAITYFLMLFSLTLDLSKPTIILPPLIQIAK
jgi:hypothetical protein